jgi:hypothetical protein
MSKEDRMADVIEAGMALRREDIELGRRLERERIIELLKGSVMTERIEWIVSLIEGGEE